MKINVKIGSPIYETIQFYGKPHPIKRVVNECKKCILLEITIENIDMGQLVYDRIFEEMRKIYTNIVSLSECVWWVKSDDEDTNCFKSSICIPKDFDHLEEQKRQLLMDARNIIREIKRDIRSKYNYSVVYDTEGCRGNKYYCINDLRI